MKLQKNSKLLPQNSLETAESETEKIGFDREIPYIYIYIYKMTYQKIINL